MARPFSTDDTYIMTVYVDEAIWRWGGLRWCHLLADDTDELHRFAASLGIKPASYQGPPKTATPHYDLTAYERRRAIAQGAVACGREAMVAVLHRVRVKRLHRSVAQAFHSGPEVRE